MRVLQVGLGNIGGGLEAFVMNYYRELSKMDVQFDFVCMYGKIAYEKEIKTLGGRIFYVPNVKKNYLGYVKRFKQILKKGNYDVVHVNMLSAANIVPLRLASKAGVRKVIAHSHNSSCPGMIKIHALVQPCPHQKICHRFFCVFGGGGKMAVWE